MSEDLTSCFVNPVIHSHSGGHFVPATSQDKMAYIKFLESVQV